MVDNFGIVILEVGSDRLIHAQAVESGALCRLDWLRVGAALYDSEDALCLSRYQNQTQFSSTVIRSSGSDLRLVPMVL
jgi:hypothetical protein